MEQVPIPGAQTYISSQCTFLTNTPLSPCHAQCVTGRYGCSWNPQRLFQRHLTQQKRMLSGLGQCTNPSEKILMVNLPPFSNICPRYVRYTIDRPISTEGGGHSHGLLIDSWLLQGQLDATTSQLSSLCTHHFPLNHENPATVHGSHG